MTDCNLTHQGPTAEAPARECQGPRYDWRTAGERRSRTVRVSVARTAGELEARLHDLREQLEDVTRRAKRAAVDLRHEVTDWDHAHRLAGESARWAWDLAPIQGELAFLRRTLPEELIRCIERKGSKADRETWGGLAGEFLRIRREADELLREHEAIVLYLYEPYIPPRKLSYQVQSVRRSIRWAKRFGKRMAWQHSKRMSVRIQHR
jgi:hypothetical protein